LGSLGPLLACLGAVLGLSWSSWSSLGRSWGCLGPLVGLSWACLGLSWALLGLSWAVLGLFRGCLGFSWGPLGRSWGCLAALLGLSWACLGLSWALRYFVKWLKSISKKLGFGNMRVSWALLGISWAVLGLSWESLGILGALLGAAGAVLGLSRDSLGPVLGFGHSPVGGAVLKPILQFLFFPNQSIPVPTRLFPNFPWAMRIPPALLHLLQFLSKTAPRWPQVESS
jgi:hypothetical protein